VPERIEDLDATISFFAQDRRKFPVLTFCGALAPRAFDEGGRTGLIMMAISAPSTTSLVSVGRALWQHGFIDEDVGLVVCPSSVCRTITIIFEQVRDGARA